MRIILLILLLFSGASHASDYTTDMVSLTNTLIGGLCVTVFIIAYIAIALEDALKIKKSVPAMASAIIIWTILGVYYAHIGKGYVVENGIRHNFLEYAELFFFLLVTMTFVNSMTEQGVFERLRHWVLQKRLSYRQIFWLNSTLAFFISPLADNLTTALVFSAIIMSVGKNNQKFVAISCVGLVVACNAGGAFSPFGDITTLMVWQSGKVEFANFFMLFIPSVINFIVPAFVMHVALPSGFPEFENQPLTEPNYPNGFITLYLFILTITTAIFLHTALHIPAVYGTMTGLVYLHVYNIYLERQFDIQNTNPTPGNHGINITHSITRAEWDTLFFFYGVILSVGGIGFAGYLSVLSEVMYSDLGQTTTNIILGIVSALIDNIPVMLSVLEMSPEMSVKQWLLITLTAGVGGSLLSIGSAAGVALMGQSKGLYTFGVHLRWSPIIFLGYIASVYVHMTIL